MNSNENIIKELQTLQLGPAWTNKNSQSNVAFNKNREHKRRKGKPFLRKKMPPPAQVYEPPVDVNLHADDDAFRALVKTLKASCKTYQLFNLANLFLEKRERFFVCFKPKAGESSHSLYIALPDNMPFMTEDGALSYAIAKQWNNYFKEDIVQLEKPAGNFQFVNKCGITDKLIGPPNYHRYNELLREHYDNNINGRCTFEHFLSEIKNDRSQESVSNWLEEMTHGKKYVLISNETVSFCTQELAKKYLIQNFKNILVKCLPSVRVSAMEVENLSDPILKKSAEFILEKEKKFPLIMANFLRGRFHHAGFSVYKRGKKGVSYVSKIKRKIRYNTTQFAQSVENLVKFIEQHNDISITELTKLYFNVTDVSKLEESVDETTLKQFKTDLHWLIMEGYVIEYEDNVIHISPIQNLPKNSNANKITKE